MKKLILMALAAALLVQGCGNDTSDKKSSENQNPAADAGFQPEVTLEKLVDDWLNEDDHKNYLSISGRYDHNSRRIVYFLSGFNPTIFTNQPSHGNFEIPLHTTDGETFKGTFDEIGFKDRLTYSIEVQVALTDRLPYPNKPLKRLRLEYTLKKLQDSNGRRVPESSHTMVGGADFYEPAHDAVLFAPREIEKIRAKQTMRYFQALLDKDNAGTKCEAGAKDQQKAFSAAYSAARNGYHSCLQKYFDAKHTVNDHELASIVHAALELPDEQGLRVLIENLPNREDLPSEILRKAIRETSNECGFETRKGYRGFNTNHLVSSIIDMLVNEKKADFKAIPELANAADYNVSSEARDVINSVLDEPKFSVFADLIPLLIASHADVASAKRRDGSLSAHDFFSNYFDGTDKWLGKGYLYAKALFKAGLNASNGGVISAAIRYWDRSLLELMLKNGAAVALKSNREFWEVEIWAESERIKTELSDPKNASINDQRRLKKAQQRLQENSEFLRSL